MTTPESTVEAVAIALSMADPDERPLPPGTMMGDFYRGLARAAIAAMPAAAEQEACARSDDLISRLLHPSRKLLRIELEQIMNEAAQALLDAHPSPADQAKLIADLERLRAEINTPITDDFTKAVNMEATHQRERWGADHDAGKSPFDWFWLVGYLAQKAADAQVRGDADKARHHTISTAAALANWHLAISGKDTSMRPGIAEPEEVTRTRNGSNHND